MQSPSGSAPQQTEKPPKHPDMAIIDVDAILQEVRTLLDQGLPADVAPVATFDADGTIWAGDVGEDFFAFFVRERLLHRSMRDPVRRWLDAQQLAPGQSATAGLTEFLRAYEAGTGHSLDAYEMMVWLMAGHRVQDLAPLCEAKAFYYASTRVFPEIRSLFERLPALGVTPYIISASNQYSVRGGARLLNLPTAQLRAIRLQVGDDGVLTDVVERPAPLDQGKVDVAKELTGGRRPLLAFGDSVYDLPMLSLAYRGFFVNPSARVRARVQETSPSHPFRCLSLPIPDLDA